MAKITTTYADRDVQYPNRYTLTNVSGTTYDLVRQEGTVNVAGTLLNKIKFDEIKTVVNGLDDYRIADETSIANLNTGWLPAGETWTYSSVDDPTGNITISGDKTSKYSLGMRIKFTNGGNVIYGIITKIAYSSPNTTMTFLHEIDPTDSLALYLMANSAITTNYYSTMKVPYGFPIEVKKWSVYFRDTADRTQSSPTKTTYYNLGTSFLNIPIGAYIVSYDVVGAAICSTAGTYMYFKTTLSTANNSESDKTMTGRYGEDFASYTASSASMVIHKEQQKTYTAKTRLYLNMMGDSGGTLASINFYGLNGCNTEIKATCAYL